MKTLPEITTSTSQQIKDSEEGIINTTYWHIQPFFEMIRRGETKKLMKNLDIQIDQFDFHERIPKDKKKEIEYMSVSLINTFMIAAIVGGVYPPEVNRIADRALQKLAAVKKASEISPIIKDAAYGFCEKVRIFRLADTGNPRVEKAKEFISTHLSRNIDLDDIAKHAGISRYHLSRIFKNATGKTVKEYLTDERITAAKNLLINDRRSISQIASLLQFCDESYFIAVFRKKTGMTPSAFQKKNAYSYLFEDLVDTGS
ncbi:MAG: AraC family transcriptional regulator [Erysipelotrichaceae bacterium]|nr:AraC family transcriptional regulator [Erysipelotrichaceae bacterium]